MGGKVICAPAYRYISLEILYRKYTVACGNDFTAHGETTNRNHNLKFTGVAQNLDQLQVSDWYFQSNFWVNSRILGQPCEFYLHVPETGWGQQAAGGAQRA
jgi:hypothetical protein